MAEGRLDAWTELIADHLTDLREVIVSEELRRMRNEAPAFFVNDDPHYVESYTASCHAHLQVLLEGLRSGRDLPGSLPPAASEETRAVADWGIALDSLVQTYRTAHSVIWEHAMDVVYTHVDSGHQSAVLKVVSRYLFVYTDRMIGFIAEMYDRERLLLFQDRNKQRRQLVRDLLDGLPIDGDKLPYTLSGVTHIAAIVNARDVERQVAHLASAAMASFLAVAGPSQTTWVWFGGESLGRGTAVAELISAVPAGLEISFGEPASGVEGFRLSHLEARQANRIASKMSRLNVRYSEIALLSLATVDESAALHFMRRELGFLASDEPRIEELRATLNTYFASGHNASTTAAKMSLNDRTVAYRLRSTEQKLGHPILERRGELAVALQLLEFFGPQRS